MLDLSSRKVYGALAEQCVGGDAKADKVETAVAGHLAGLDANGNLTDSGVSPTEEVTVEGNPVTFESPFEQDAKSVVVSVKPIQDLHGYDHPWVGGANVNKMPAGEAKTVNESGVTITSDGHGIYTISGTPSQEVLVEFMCENSFVIPDGQANTLGMMNSESTPNVHFCFVNGNTQVDSWNLDPAGKKAHYAAMANKPCDRYWIKVLVGFTGSVTLSPMICEGDLNNFPSTFTWYSNSCPISGIDEVEIGVSDGESEPTTTTIPLPSTLYGGEVDVKTGVLTVDRAIHNVTWGDGTGDTILGSNTRKRLPDLPDVPTNILTATISNIVPYLQNWESDTPHFYIQANKQNYAFLPNDTSADTQIQICYELATPIELDITPAILELLEGTNVVSTNAEKVAVTYGRSLWQDIDDLKTDTEGKLNKSDVATIEGDTASKAYSVNDFMLRADGLYKVTQPIAQNASITSSNTTKTTIGAVLTALLNS